MRSVILLAILYALPVVAQTSDSVSMDFIDASGLVGVAGTVKYEDTAYGLLLTPQLVGLQPGVHGFHIHDKPSCAPAEVNGQATAGAGAGGHWDPAKTGAHLGPYTDQGHKGDLPALYVAADGTATYPVLAPRLKANDVIGHALMLHLGADNHSDHPKPLGGGGSRIVCGVFK